MKYKAGIAVIMSAALINISAFAQSTFLCMRPNENIAITADSNANYQYINMQDSNGLSVYPLLSTDGNTYLPFRFICEKSGLKDGEYVDGELPDGYFRYLGPEKTNGAPKIEIRCNGTDYSHNVNEPFQYILPDGDVRTVAMYNIRGILYAPMKYLALITNSKALWQGDSGQVMFLSNSLIDYNYINTDNNHLRRDKELYLGFDYFCNNLTDTSLYLKTDGMTVSDLSTELGERVKSVTRNSDKIYFIDENGFVKVKTEDQNDTAYVNFGKTVTADNVIAVQNKLYGIAVDAPGEKYGRLFCSELDGSNFTYMTAGNVYNLMLKKNVLDMYLFYCDADTKSAVHMIPLNTMDNYTLEITDFDRNNMLNDIKQFVIADNNIVYIDNCNVVHTVTLNTPPEKLEVARLDSGRHKAVTASLEGDALDKIISMNCDYLNGVVYLTSADGKVYYFTKYTNGFKRIQTYTEPIKGITLFSNMEYTNLIMAESENNLYTSSALYDNGAITIQ